MMTLIFLLYKKISEHNYLYEKDTRFKELMIEKQIVLNKKNSLNSKIDLEKLQNTLMKTHQERIVKLEKIKTMKGEMK